MKALLTPLLALSFIAAQFVYAPAWAKTEDPAAETEQADAPKKKARKKPAAPFKFEKSLKKALAKAKKTGMPVMLLFTNPPTCPYCQKLEDEILHTTEWKKSVAGKLIGVYIDDGNKDKDARAFRSKNNVSGIPTFFYLKPDGTILGKGGYYPGGDVARYVAEVERHYKTVHDAFEADQAKKAEEKAAKDAEKEAAKSKD